MSMVGALIGAVGISKSAVAYRFFYSIFPDQRTSQAAAKLLKGISTTDSAAQAKHGVRHAAGFKIFAATLNGDA